MSTGTKDYYALLGVAKTATEAEIKKAFRARARETHPDVNNASDAEEQFKAINEAYDVLSDPQKRQMYDQYGTADPRASGGGVGDMGDIFAGFGMDDLFSAFFGGGFGGQRARMEGRDIVANVSITLEEAATGVQKEVVLNRLVPCEECSASGSADGDGSQTCSGCNGSGQKQTYRRTILGTMSTMAPCDECSGTGRVIEHPCPECNGQGRVPDREHVKIDVPAGMRDQMQLRLRGSGEAGIRGAAAGDLLVTVRVLPHEYLHREGDDLHCRTTISMAQAALGAELTVCGIGGDNQVTMPAGSQHGDTLRIRGKGMPHLRGTGLGDLIVHLAIDIPKKLTKRQRELLEELGESFGDPEHRRPMQKLRDWLTG
ncbi:MAG: molecular chaperone DnaJ [Actinomycetota bacterium]|nr:molecular chaperone DnaJ [Actinomycetota bacterium]